MSNFLIRQILSQPRNVARGDRTNESAPTSEALPNCIRSDLQAASLVGWISRTLLELAIGIARGFIAWTARVGSMRVAMGPD
jgi:hypothetical protein